MTRFNHSLRKWWWFLHRFGLTPSKIYHRLGNQTEPRILCVSIPKAGTNLLERSLCLHPALYRRLLPTVTERNLYRWGNLECLLAKLRPGQVVVSHLGYTPERWAAIQSCGVKAIFMVRDPRDVILSAAYYILKRKNHALYGPSRSLPDLKARLKLVIDGYAPSEVAPFPMRLQAFTGWLDSGLLLVRFEDLIGPAGRGERQRQIATLQALYSHIGITADVEWLGELAHQLFATTSPTFHRGYIGQWKEYFDPEITSYFKKEVGWSVVRFGYEENENWLLGEQSKDQADFRSKTHA